MNTWNTRSYALRGQPPLQFIYNLPDARQSVNVWVGLTVDNHIIGPFFAPGNINGNVYLELINNQIVLELHKR